MTSLFHEFYLHASVWTSKFRRPVVCLTHSEYFIVSYLLDAFPCWIIRKHFKWKRTRETRADKEREGEKTAAEFNESIIYTDCTVVRVSLSSLFFTHRRACHCRELTR